MAIHLSSSADVLPGIGKQAYAHLRNLDVISVRDLLLYFPYRYDDFSQTKPIPDLQPEDVVTLEVEIQSIETRPARTRKRLKITEALVTDGHGSLKAIWFNQPYLEKTLRPGTRVALAGKINAKYGLTLTNPIYEKGKKRVNTGRIVPVYGLSGTLTMRRLRNAIKHALKTVSEFDEWLPPHIVEREGFSTRAEAIRHVHFPPSRTELERAIARLKFEELFLHQLLFAAVRKQRKQHDGYAVDIDTSYLRTFVDHLSFDLTGAQRKAVWEIVRDCEAGIPMNRLLEGDVGSGKTVVAAMAAGHLLKQSPCRVAYLAPTEILAAQHHASFVEYLPDQQVALLTRSRQKIDDREVEKEEVIDGIANENIRIVIGTHALLQENIELPDLGMVIIDEQHRFGVQQRHALLNSGEAYAPHLLSMTATPIPRSLALTMYGDLDLSVLDEMPAGRKPVATKVVYENERDGMWQHVASLIDTGQQAYVVCPLIDPSDVMGARSVQEVSKSLQSGALKNYTVKTLHGKLKSDKKTAIIKEFRDGKIDVLVATTVIEVGVDVPNATVMVIVGAERFGLAQLHQLRGRVGRSDVQSYCYLLPETTLNNKAKERLEAMEASTDGFALARIDLKLRGAGNVFGNAQSGFPDFDLATPADVDIMKNARDWARNLLEEDDGLEPYPDLQAHVQKSLDQIHLE